MGAACSNSNKVVQATVRKTKKGTNNADDSDENHDGIVNDPNYYNQSDVKVVRTHEKLWKAIENNDRAAAEKFLEVNDIQENNLFDPFGQSMLHKAAQLGFTEMLMLLIDRTGAKPDLVNSNLATPLHLACRSNREAVVKFLIGCGVDANSQDEHGQTPLLICCIHGHKEIVSVLIEASIVGHLPEPLEVDTPNHQGLTPLNCAAIKGDFDIVKCLVTRGGTKVDQSSPKGCTPLIYAGRGGYLNVVEFLLQKKASALKQDNAGGTVFHHAIEKGHINILDTMLQNGVDVYSAIEIADNAGRTPLFEAVENLNEENSKSGIEIIKILTRSKQNNGYEANPNVVNYNGQTPLFSATRQGFIEAVKALIQAQADPDLQNGEMVKPEDDEEEEYESIQEKYFMEAFKNCMTPLHVAAVLGYDDIALYLVQECGADPNIQTRAKGFTALHLSVLANKPEMLIELLTKTQADPMIEDCQGRTLLDMVYQFIPSYVETFQTILENLSAQRITSQQERNVSIKQDDRQITGAKTQEQIQQMYAKEMEMKEEENNTTTKAVNLATIDENDLQTDLEIDERVENVFGRKVALCLVSQNWQYKELALKFVFRTSEKFLTRAEVGPAMPFTLCEMVDGTLAAVSLTCRDKVIKVFNISLQLFNMVVQSSRIERDVAAIKKVRSVIKKEEIISKFLVQSEQTNTRLTNKIHEALLDLCFQPHLGEEMVVGPVFELINKHNTQNSNPKGLLAQIALLFKLVNSFDVKLEQEDGQDKSSLTTLNKQNVLSAILPSVNHTKDDVRNAAVKLLVDLQQRTAIFQIDDLKVLSDKTRDTLWEKMQQKQDQEEYLQSNNQKRVAVVNLEVPEKSEKISKQQLGAVKLTEQALEKFKQTITEKSQQKDWTQREIALNTIQECFSMNINGLLDREDDFLSQCTILLQSSLDDNNMQIYISAVEATEAFVKGVSNCEAVLDALPSLIQALVLRTTDTNTRIRKRSVEVINIIWELQLNKKSNSNASQIVANVLCDPSLNEKAIIGRLGLFIKKALAIETPEDMSKKPLQLILGKDYEQLIQFACSWCLHKNTKVRQCALKLAVEICRLNSIDVKGAPFKQRIINFILGLRSSIRDPLIKKINEVCKSQGEMNQDYINQAEYELTLATKTRAASLDIRRGVARGDVQKEVSLPQISGAVQQQQVSSDLNARPAIVLPHSEPLSDATKEEWSSLIDLFGLELVKCYNSQSWSNRLVAIQKTEEQLVNLDPNRRDAMLCEINRNNLPPEVTFKLFIKLTQEGLKDPVLKNYIAILDLIQKSLPLYFRYLRPEQIRRELTPLISSILSKTSDLKQKVREASMNFCLYLSHQSPVGPETMTNLVLSELSLLQWDKSEANNSMKKDLANTFGNSNMIASCLKLLGQYQQQTNLVTETSTLYSSFFLNINKSLKHSNPQVRKEGESLFYIMHKTFKDNIFKEIKDQKPQIIQKLTAEVKQQGQDQTAEQSELPINQISKELQEKNSVQHAQNQLKEDYLSQPSIIALLKGNEDKLHQLKLPNPKKRLIAIVEIKKFLQQKLNQVNQVTAKELVEPISLLIRHLLRDDNPDVYLETLSLLKFIVGSLAQHLSTLDLHLMMGQFISVIVSGSNQNMRQRVASDKVIVFFAKHNNIGSYIVAKEVLKNIERLNKTAFTKIVGAISNEDELEERKMILSRFYGILQLLVQQFSIVLCYQPEFYTKCLEQLADTLSKAADEPSIKSICHQLVINLFQIDAKLLDQGVQSLDFTKKTHLKKIIIELENSQQKGQQVLMSGNQNFISAAGASGTSRLGSPDASFRDTQQSFTSQVTRQTIMSPSVGLNRRLTRDRNSEIRSSRTNTEVPAATISETPHEFRKATIDQGNIGNIPWLDRKTSEANKTVTLPSIVEPNVRKRQFGQGFIGNLASGKAAGFNRDQFNSTASYSNKKSGQVLDDNFSQITANNGLGSGLISQKNQGETFQLQSQRKNFNPMEIVSPNASISMPLANPDIIENKAGAVRPPLYVPTQRTINVANKIEGYQPTLLERKTSQTAAFSEQGQGIDKVSGISQRYKQPSQLPALNGLSFGTNQIKSTSAAISQGIQSSAQNEILAGQLNQGLNKTSLVEENPVGEQVPQRRQSQYRDITRS